MKLLAIDPGDKNQGFALFETRIVTATYTKTDWTKVKIGVRLETDELYQLIKTQEPDIVVVEKFMVYPWKGKQQSWSKQKTPQVIGGVKALATVYDFKVVEQSTANRDIGYMWGEITRLPKSNPSSHAHDAWAHAVFYIIDNGGVINGS